MSRSHPLLPGLTRLWLMLQRLPVWSLQPSNVGRFGAVVRNAFDLVAS